MKALTRQLLPILAVAALVPTAACAQSESFADYLEDVSAKARAEGVSDGAIRTVTAGLEPSRRVMALDQDNVSSGGRVNPATGFAYLSSYIARHNTQARITAGRRKMAQVRYLAAEVEEAYGVPEQILVAIWGHETAYGAVKGNFDLPQALATLAWEGRRRELFEGELIATMQMVDEGVPRSALKGSWAGAFGNPQFLPSVYLRIAVDGDGDGDRDIWDSDADTLHSIGNYFRASGWRPGEPWGVRAFVPNSVDVPGVEAGANLSDCPRVHNRHGPWMTVREYREAGVTPRAPIGDDVLVSLFEPDGRAAPGYLITRNYEAILKYNCSNYYAMSVGLLADEIVR